MLLASSGKRPRVLLTPCSRCTGPSETVQPAERGECRGVLAWKVLITSLGLGERDAGSGVRVLKAIRGLDFSPLISNFKYIFILLGQMG